MANQPLGFQQEQCHGSFWKATGTLNFLSTTNPEELSGTAGTLFIEDGVV
jgi:hypothetical protein